MKAKILLTVLTLSLLVTPVEPIMANSKTENIKMYQQEILPKADLIDYLYKIKDGVVYKRLYNFTRHYWVGAWELA